MFWLDEQLMDYWEECDRIRDERIKEEIELEEKCHPILTKIDNTRVWLAGKILGI